MFLNFREISGSVSYKLVSYKKSVLGTTGGEEGKEEEEEEGGEGGGKGHAEG